jgi:membrane-associated phospholipid phosphatase
MLLWAGIALILMGIASFAIDRRAVHVFYDRVNAPFWRLLSRTTHLAKAGRWLMAAGVAWLLAQGAMRVWGSAPGLETASRCALAFFACIVVGSAILHSIKLVLGRRRPRDEIEMNLYGFVPFAFNLDYNSFPSGHALTIMCVAVIATALWPHWALLWFAVALWLGLTRAFLIAHFLSDVFVGAGIGVLVAREILIHFFAPLAPVWF